MIVAIMTTNGGLLATFRRGNPLSVSLGILLLLSEGVYDD